MRLFPTILLLSCLCTLSRAQTTFWTEDFETTPANTSSDPSMIGWNTTNTGANSGLANLWYRSCQENGQAANVCGAGCGSDESLHVGSATLGDIGAAYDASQTTNKRVESPVINCTGYNGITLNFEYITYGEPGFDYTELMYNDGTGWTTLVSPIPVTTCCNAGVGGAGCNGFRQGFWTAYSIALPASANNNANVQIGFNWINDNSSGSDPSFAVDDIDITYAVSLPIELGEFSGRKTESGNLLAWNTLTEINNDFFTIERSSDAINFNEIGIINGAGNSQSKLEYIFLDDDIGSATYYYRLKQTDFNGAYSYSNIVVLEGKTSQGLYYDNNNKVFRIEASDAQSIIVYGSNGQQLAHQNCEGKRSIPLALSKGMYIVRLKTSNGFLTSKVMVMND